MDERKIYLALFGLTLVAVANGWQNYHIKKMHEEFRAGICDVVDGILDTMQQATVDRMFDSIVDNLDM